MANAGVTRESTEAERIAQGPGYNFTYFMGLRAEEKRRANGTIIGLTDPLWVTMGPGRQCFNFSVLFLQFAARQWRKMQE